MNATSNIQSDRTFLDNPVGTDGFEFVEYTAPDPELLAAAENGEIQTPSGLARQVDRMLASPRVEEKRKRSP